MYGGADNNVAGPVVDKSVGDVIQLTSPLFDLGYHIYILITATLLFLWLCIFILIGLIFLELPNRCGLLKPAK